MDRVEGAATGRVYVDYRKIIPVSVVLLIPILFLGLSSMVLDIRQLGQ